MEGTIYQTPAAVLRRGQEAIGIPFREMDKTGRLRSGKGAVGNVVEESWFGYTPNSDAEPDFPEAGVELKVTPYVRNRRGLRAKERLVGCLINYETEWDKTFETSDFCRKCGTMLILSYEHRPDADKGDLFIDHATLFRFPEEDLAIIRQDWETIRDKIRAGQAHLLTEGDTLYLAACTKGATAATMRRQPFSPIPAKQRAYSLKPAYMTRILNEYVFGARRDERIIQDWRLLERQSFEAVLLERLRPYLGWTEARLWAQFGGRSAAKSRLALLLGRMLGVRGPLARTAEFQSAGICPKTVRIQRSGRVRESMSFPAFRFSQLLEETWETSALRQQLEPTKFLFVVFREQADGQYCLERVKLWNMPAEDREEVRRVWERTRALACGGVRLCPDGRVVRNNLPKASESPVAHVRSHGRDASDVDVLPDGTVLPKQCFWLNNRYIERILQAE